MANLGNLKIKDTYQLVLQTDASGNLQRLDGSTPSPFIVNGNLRYLDGSQANGYVLISDASGNASWGPVDTGDIFISGGTIEDTVIKLFATGGDIVSIPGLSWSANTNGSISNSGLTSTKIGIGTDSPTNKLHVKGNSTSDNPFRLETVQAGRGYVLVVDDDGVVYKSKSASGAISASTIEVTGDLKASGTINFSLIDGGTF